MSKIYRICNTYLYSFNYFLLKSKRMSIQQSIKYILVYRCLITLLLLFKVRYKFFKLALNGYQILTYFHRMDTTGNLLFFRILIGFGKEVLILVEDWSSVMTPRPSNHHIIMHRLCKPIYQLIKAELDQPTSTSVCLAKFWRLLPWENN